MDPQQDRPCADGQVEKSQAQVPGLVHGVQLSPWGLEQVSLTVSLFPRDVRSLGITMMGHQKKILSSIQAMRSQLLNTNGPRRHL